MHYYNNQFRKFCTLTDYYYNTSGGRIMPLFLLYLAKEGNLEVGDRSRDAVKALDPERKYRSHAYAQFSKDDARKLAVKDPAGRHLLDRWECNDQKQISLLFHYDFDNPVLQTARELFQKHDEVLADGMEKRRALFLFCQGLLALGADFLKENYLQAAFYIIEKSGLFPSDEDYGLAVLESVLLSTVSPDSRAYYADAVTPFTAAVLGRGQWEMEIEGKDSELVKAVVGLLFADKADSASVSFCDKPFRNAPDAEPYDLIVSNSKKKDNDPDKVANIFNVFRKGSRFMSENGLFIGVDDMKFFFNSTCRRSLFRDAADKGKIAKVIVLPREYDSVLVVIDNSKKNTDIELINLLNEVMDPEKILTGLDRYVAFHSKTITLEQLKKERHSIGNFFKYKVEDVPGMKTVKLGRLLNRIERSSSSLGMIGVEQEEFNKIEYPSGVKYSPFYSLTYGVPSDEICIYDPSYILYERSLIVKNHGTLEPYIFDPQNGPAYLKDGLAFSFKPYVEPFYIINELRKSYMTEQLTDWTSSRQGLHSEDEILSLLIHCPFDEDGQPDFYQQDDICDKELDENNLPVGQDIRPAENEGRPEKDRYFYIITEVLGKGAFSINYLADRYSDVDFNVDKVVLKEFFVRLTDVSSKRGEDLVTRHSIGTVEAIKNEADESAEKRRFIKEAELMMKFGDIEGSCIRRAHDIFTCNETNNLYYVTDYYENDSLSKMVGKYGVLEEDEAINRIIIPLAKALYVLHSNRILHLDLKPDNVLIDDDGMAVLSDFGISKEYDENGNEVTHGQKFSSSAFSPVSDFEKNVSPQESFHPELDIFALGCIFYYVVTGENPTKYRPERLEGKLSAGSMAVIKNALLKDPKKRTSNVMDFVHGLPGHENDDFSGIINSK